MSVVFFIFRNNVSHAWLKLAGNLPKLMNLTPFLNRLEEAIFCPGNTPDHNPAILNQIRSNVDFDYYYSTHNEMEAYVDAYFG